MNTAKLVKRLDGFTGMASLYQLSPPFEYEDWCDETKTYHEYVVVSATVAMFSGPETLAFPANANGEVTDWGELAGFRNCLDHEAVLESMGYEVETS